MQVVGGLQSRLLPIRTFCTIRSVGSTAGASRKPTKISRILRWQPRSHPQAWLLAGASVALIVTVCYALDDELIVRSAGWQPFPSIGWGWLKIGLSLWVGGGLGASYSLRRRRRAARGID
jgi:hypothetical protein